MVVHWWTDVILLRLELWRSLDGGVRRATMCILVECCDLLGTEDQFLMPVGKY